VKRPSAHSKHPSRPARPGSTRSSGHSSDPVVDPVARSSRSRRRRFLTRLPAVLFVVPLLVGVIGGPVTPAGADELSDARSRQDALAQQLKNQKEAVAQINALQADLSTQIASTRKQLTGIAADLTTVRKNISTMVVKINVVKQHYLALVAQLELLDTQLSRLKISEYRARWHLQETKDLLAERLRDAYDTDRTSLLETFLSGGSFTDVLSQVSYSIDMGEQDKALAQQIIQDQAALAALHQTVSDTRSATDDLRVETAATRVKLDAQLAELKAAQKELKRLEAETAKALQIERQAYAKLAANKKNLAKAIAATAAAKKKHTDPINAIVAAAYAQGNIPSRYNGTLDWPMNGSVTQNFGCTGFEWEPPLGSCPHFHQGIDIVADYGTPVRASGDGRIVYCGWNYADGADPAWIVIIAHSQALETWYAHMTPDCPVAQGASVRGGQVIGHEGNTGHSTGAHLHWAVRFNDEFVNPRLFL
jgi:murein DD-endopeptidase MepM/ murein hydrolase activator NlpD